MAPIAQSGPFGVQKCCFWPETFFFGHPCKGVNRKMLSFWCPVMVVTNKVGQFPKKWDPGQKTAFFARNSAFFYATPMKPPFFRLGRSRINGIISPPYPEVTLDTFSFLVGGCLAAWRAVSWPRLPKVALLGSKNAVFGPKPFFVDTRAKDSTEKCCLLGVPSRW